MDDWAFFTVSMTIKQSAKLSPLIAAWGIRWKVQQFFTSSRTLWIAIVNFSAAVSACCLFMKHFSFIWSQGRWRSLTEILGKAAWEFQRQWAKQSAANNAAVQVKNAIYKSRAEHLQQQKQLNILIRRLTQIDLFCCLRQHCCPPPDLNYVFLCTFTVD